MSNTTAEPAPTVTVPSHRERLALYSTTGYLPVAKLALSHAGFTPTNVEGEVECAWCKLRLKNFRRAHQPLAWHRAFASKVCPFLLNNIQCNRADLGEFPDRRPMVSHIFSSGPTVLQPIIPSGYDEVDTGDNLISMTDEQHNLTDRGLSMLYRQYCLAK